MDEPPPPVPGEPPAPGRSRWTVVRDFWLPLPIWQRLDASVAHVAGYTALVVLAGTEADLHLPDWSSGPAVLNTLVLGVLLGFRNQVAYARWWEGRQLWGQLVNSSRSLCAKSAAFPGLSTSARSEIGRLVPAFAVALKDWLRGMGALHRVPGFESARETPAHVPLFLFCRLVAVLQDERTAGRLTEMDLRLLDPHVQSLIAVCGGCERIKNTPLPLSYRALVRHGLVIYLLTSPWLVADHLGWWTVPMMSLLVYFLLGIEFTAEDIEEPFGRDADDLALSDYCETIRRSVEQVLGEKGPVSSKSTDGFLPRDGPGSGR
jgi:putative membrane protein